MGYNSSFKDTLGAVRDHFIVVGDYVVDADKVVAVSSVFTDTEAMNSRFKVLMLGGHELSIAADWEPTRSNPYAKDPEKQRKATWEMQLDFLVQWRTLRTLTARGR